MAFPKSVLIFLSSVHVMLVDILRNNDYIHFFFEKKTPDNTDTSLQLLSNTLSRNLNIGIACTKDFHPIRCPRDFAPPVISPLQAQIPRDLAPPGAKSLGISPSPFAPPFRDLAPPPPPFPATQLENILVFRPSYQESFWNMVWQFIWQWICASQTRSQCCLIFSKVGVDFLVIVYVNIVLQLRAWFCCVFLILLNLSIISWVILVSD